ncbi:cadherin repeat domain-containing protein, partial [Porticoccaceae bacterium]|nr:cadherin repeat domain-containing protein [Porticoccaceae bacterium]
MSEQKVYIDGNVVQVSEGTAQVVVRYTGAPSTTGLGIRVHFDSSLLTVTDVSGVLTGSIFANNSPTADTDNYDGDASTDVYVDAAWASLFGGWPGSSDVELMTITFAADADFVAANINFSASSSAEGFEFVPVSATVQAPAPAIEVDNTSATVDENAPVGTEVATVSSGLSGATFSIAGGDASGSDPVIPDLAAATQHVYVSSSTRSEDGTQETLQITYNADAGNTGLGLRIHFDSTKVSVASLEDVLPGSIFANSTASADTDNFDNDASTDSYIDIAWASLFGGWPGATPASLATLTFDIADGATGSTAVNFSASSNASGFEFAPQNHALTLSAEAGPVTVDAETGVITTNQVFDYETDAPIEFTVVATGSDGATAEETVQLTINNMDEVAPTITSSDSVDAIDENDVEGQVIYTASADDSLDISSGITFSLSDDSDDALSIDSVSGAVTLASDANYESQSVYSFTVVASDGVNAVAEKSLSLDVNDLDETAPQFDSAAPAEYVWDSNSASQVIYTAEATDYDDNGNENPTVEFSLENASADLAIDQYTGDVTVEVGVDSVQSSYDFDVVASDGVNQSSQPVSINIITDITAPSISSPSTVDSIDENSGSGQVIYTAQASDENSFTWDLSNDSDAALSIDSSTGEVTLSDDPNYEAQSEYNFTVVAIDSFDNSSSLSLSLEVNNLDEVAPTINSGDTGVAVDENSGAGQLVYAASADDSLDTSAGVTFSLADDSLGFSIDAVTGDVTTNADFAADFESAESQSFVVVASDGVNADVEQQVTIAINNLDEVAPSINSGDTGASVDENSGAGQVVYTATATDDADTSDGFSFSLADDTLGFSIDAVSGVVTTNSDFAADFEAAQSQSFTVVATDVAGNASQQTVSVAVNNLDEVAPSIDSGDTGAAVNENSGAGQVVYTAAATDTDANIEGITFNLADDTLGFSIDAESGVVTTNEDFAADYEGAQSQSFIVVATDEAANFSVQEVTVAVNNLDEVAPTITSADTAGSIDENSGAGSVIYTATADDSLDTSAGVTFSLSDGSDAALSIDAATGEVTLSDDADHETQPSYSFTVVASDGVNANVEQSVFLDVNNLDEVAPVVTDLGDRNVVNFTHDTTSVIYTAVATDLGDVSKLPITFGFAKGSDPALSIDSVTGEVTLDETPNYAVQDQYQVSIIATDAAGNTSAPELLTVNVTDDDPNAPLFGLPTERDGAEAYTIVSSQDEINGTTITAVAGSVDENIGAGQVVYSVSTIDASNVTYALSDDANGAFTIDELTGEVTLVSDPDFESGETSFNFTVLATDQFGHASEQLVNLSINNLDDTAPVITSSNAASVEENSGADQIVYIATSSSDQFDTGEQVVSEPTTYSLAEGHDPVLAINATSGEVSLMTNPDQEAKAQYVYTVIATDAAGNSSEQQVTLTVGDVDDTAPTITSGASAQVNEKNDSGTVVYTAEADDSLDVSEGAVTFSLTSDSDVLSIDSITGDVSLDESADHEVKDSYQFTVVAEDTAGNSSQQNVTLSVTDLDEIAPEITSSDSVSIDENDALGQVIYTASSNDSLNLVKQGPISQEFVTNDDGTVTVRLFVDSSHREYYPDGIDSINLKLAYSTEESNVLSVNNINFSHEAFYSSDGDYNGVVSLAMIYASDDMAEMLDVNQSIYYADSEVAFAEVTFSVIDSSAINQFVVSQVSIGQNDGVSTTPDGESVYLYAASGDSGVIYSLEDADNGLLIDSASGEVSLSSELSYESGEQYSFTLVATDAAGNPSEQEVTVSVNNLDEVAPTITSGNSAGTLNENSGEGQVVYAATADDGADTSDGVTFSLTVDSLGFSIDADTGVVTTNADFAANYEDAQSQSFTVVATDAAGNASEQVVAVAVVDLDESAVEITSGVVATAIDENTGAGSVIYTATADDSLDTSAGVTFSLAAGSDAALSINASTGAVTLASDADYEGQSSYSFTVVASDGVNTDAEQVVTLDINNLDEVAATITSGNSGASIDENSGASQVVYTATADDSADISGGVTFSLVDGTQGFSIDAESGVVTTNDEFVADYDVLNGQSQSFTVVAKDTAGNSSSQVVAIAINNIDEIAPIITSGDTVSIDENSGAAQVVYSASATDSDFNVQGITYRLTEGSDVALSVDADGVVSLAHNPDYEEQNSYSFGLIATDAAGNDSDVENITVVVNDVTSTTVIHGATSMVMNDVSMLNGSINKVVSSDDIMAVNAKDALVMMQFSVGMNIDSYGGDQELQALASDFNSDGRVKSADALELLDYLVGNSSYNPSWASIETGSDKDSASYSAVVVGDADGSWSSSSQSLTINVNEDAVGDVIYQYDPTRAIINQIPDGLTVDLARGKVSVSKELDHDEDYSFIVTSFDGSEQTVNVSVINVDTAAPDFGFDGLETLTIDENSGDNQTFYIATADDVDSTKGSDGVVYKLVGGSDSAISVLENGNVVLTDNPDYDAQPSYSFTIEATDAAGNSTTQNFVLNVNEILDVTPPQISSGDSGADVDENSGAGQLVYSAVASDDEDAVENITFSLADETLGFSIDENGLVTTNDDFAANYEDAQSQSFTVVATDTAGNADEQVVTVAVNNFDEVAPTITSGDSAGSIDENSGGGTVIYTAAADDSLDDASAGVTFSLAAGHDAALSINADGEVILAS